MGKIFAKLLLIFSQFSLFKSLLFNARRSIFPSSKRYNLIHKSSSRPLLSPLSMAVTLFGSQQTRSPLIDWYLLEKNIPYTKKAPARDCGHPFGQIPFLTDDTAEGKAEIFESGAILLYLADSYGGNVTPIQRAKYTKWVVWANSELDYLCFGKGMSGTMLDKANRGLDVLENILSNSDWLVDNTFSVADVAVGSYLNYVPLFFSNVRPVSRPNLVKYMRRCAQREAFSKAFGEEHAQQIISFAAVWAP